MTNEWSIWNGGSENAKESNKKAKLHKKENKKEPIAGNDERKKLKIIWKRWFGLALKNVDFEWREYRSSARWSARGQIFVGGTFNSVRDLPVQEFSDVVMFENFVWQEFNFEEFFFISVFFCLFVLKS